MIGEQFIIFLSQLTELTICLLLLLLCTANLLLKRFDSTICNLKINKTRSCRAMFIHLCSCTLLIIVVVHIPTLKVLCNSSIVRLSDLTCCCNCSECARSLSSDLVKVSEDCFSSEYKLEILFNSAEEWRTFSWYCRLDSSSNWHWLWSSVTLAVRASSLEWAVWTSVWASWSCFWREWYNCWIFTMSRYEMRLMN